MVRGEHRIAWRACDTVSGQQYGKCHSERSEESVLQGMDPSLTLRMTSQAFTRKPYDARGAAMTRNSTVPRAPGCYLRQVV